MVAGDEVLVCPENRLLRPKDDTDSVSVGPAQES